MVCKACGAANAPGDAFCGNCGAFLEWSAEAGQAAATGAEETRVVERVGPEPDLITVAEPEPAAGASEPAAPSVPGPGLPPPRSADIAPEAGPGSAPATVSAPGPVGAAEGGGPTCPSCGLANDPGRTFCRRCGARLPATQGPRPAPSSARPAPGAAALTGPAPARPPPAVPPPAVSPAEAPPAAPASLPASRAPGSVEPLPAPVIRAAPAVAVGPRPGPSRLLIIGGGIVALVLVAIGAFAVLSGGSGGPAPTAAPTPARTAVATPGETTAPTEQPTLEPTRAAETPSSATPPPETPPPTPVATVPSGPAIGIKVLGADASTSANDKSAPPKAFDGSPATAWLEGANDLEGQWIEIRIPPTAVTRLSFLAGVQSSRDAYDGNPRPRNVTVSFDGGQALPLKLTDTFGAQRVDIPSEFGIAAAQTIRITIIDAYPAKKTTYAGSPTATVGFSEIRVFGITAGP